MVDFEFEEPREGNVFFDYLNEEEEENFSARIKVIGAGGGGGNAVRTMLEAEIKGVEFIIGNTDAQALSASPVPLKMQLGKQRTRGLGAGGKPEIGKAAALDDEEAIRSFIKGADMVFVTAGMGGGTGTGSAPVIAAIAKEMNALTVGVVTKPFSFEGRRRMKNADDGLAELRKNVDTLIVIPNQQLLGFVPKNTSAPAAFAIADNVLCQAVKGISELITGAGLINLDFADVQSVMSSQGLALMGVGRGSGDDRALEAAQNAVNSPLLEDSSIEGARGILINITGSSNLTLHEINDAASYITDAADPDAEVFFGTVFDEAMGDDVAVTVIATGFHSAQERSSQPATRAQGTYIPTQRRATPEEQVAPPAPMAPMVPAADIPAPPPAQPSPASRLQMFEGGADFLSPDKVVENTPKPLLKTVNGDPILFEDDLEIPTFIRRQAD